MRIKSLLLVFMFVGSIFLAAVQDAEARRAGGGRSFGSRSSMQKSTSAPKQQSAVTQKTSQGKSSGFLGGAGGMLGGVLAGTFLGAMLFGDDDGGGGGMFDILLLLLLLYLGYKFFKAMQRRKAAASYGSNYARTATAGAGAATGNSGGMQYQNTSQNFGGGWDNLQGNNGPQAYQNANIPAGFDVEDFLEGAKVVFNRLQAAWDKRDFDDLALFTTDVAYNELKNQLEEDQSVNKTEVLMLKAQLLSVKQDAGDEIASVFFDVIMRENSREATEQVREIWHFLRPASGGNWKLDGIQQVDD